MLHCNFTIRTECKSLAQQLDFITQDAHQDFPTLSETVYDIRREDEQFQILNNGKLCNTTSDRSSLIYNLLGLIHSRVFKSITGCILIHTGCGEYNGKRFLIVGDKGTGKSTLMTRLLFEGFRIDGDELVLVHNEKVTPFPRRFLIKESSIHLLPQVKSMIDSVPYIQADNGSKIYSFSPSDAGFSWKIETRKAEFFFYLEPNHGGETRVEKCPKYLMVQKVMPRTFLSNTHDHLKIGQLCRMIDDSDCYILRLGNLDSAISSVREKVSLT
ncbi:MAG: hypothetical protein L0Y68_00040 [Candidatus Dadabacteria bacterium]|nr:hypothetical protein [Candidatus Dadabacteria bacterium]